jgi:hypothetical protein
MIARTFQLQELVNGEWQSMEREFTGTGVEPMLRAQTALDRLISTRADRTRFRFIDTATKQVFTPNAIIMDDTRFGGA